MPFRSGDREEEGTKVGGRHFRSNCPLLKAGSAAEGGGEAGEEGAALRLGKGASRPNGERGGGAPFPARQRGGGIRIEGGSAAKVGGGWGGGLQLTGGAVRPP